jgi:DNA-binding IclR family transcriptional regulator
MEVAVNASIGLPGNGLAPPAYADISTSVVKSAGRALQILEFFDRVQREACVTEISASLQFPQSSTSVLLRSLVAMGYLNHDRVKRTYLPTRRVCLLGNWVDPGLVQHGVLLDMAERLSVETGESVVMATVNGLNAQYIYARRHRGHAVPAIGAMLPLARTAVGQALLATFDDARISILVRRVNAERRAWEEPIDSATFIAKLRTGRARGAFVGAGAAAGDLGVAATFDAGKDGQLLAIGIEGPEQRVGPKLDPIMKLLTWTASRVHPLGAEMVA